MSFMYRIGVIGDYDSICGFSTLGLDIFPVTDVATAREQLKTLTNGAYGVIYITEVLAEALKGDCEEFREALYPAIVPIPACTGVTGFGRANVKYCVEQAVGSDIIFNDE